LLDWGCQNYLVTKVDLPDTDNLWRTLEFVSEWVKFADAKAGAILAADGVLLALLIGQLDDSRRSAVALAVLRCAIACAVSSGILAVWAVVPRVHSSGSDSLIHYGRISKFASFENYRDTVTAAHAAGDEIPTALMLHIWTLSRVARHKYRLISWAVRLLAAAIGVGVLILGLL
jgi:hypothetical protein